MSPHVKWLSSSLLYLRCVWLSLTIFTTVFMQIWTTFNVPPMILFRFFDKILSNYDREWCHILLHAIYGMQLSYSSKFRVVVSGERWWAYRSWPLHVNFSTFRPTAFVVERQRKMFDCSRKIYIIERLISR
jgi:hypothetical protein